MTKRRRLLAVKLVHTAVWAVVASAIFALFPSIAFDRLDWFWGLHAIVGAEVLALLTFRWRCPLTYVAERYTEDRAPNFDIFLPRWLAHWNKEVFSAVLVAAWAYAALRWLV